MMNNRTGGARLAALGVVQGICNRAVVPCKGCPANLEIGKGAGNGVAPVGHLPSACRLHAPHSTPARPPVALYAWVQPVSTCPGKHPVPHAPARAVPQLPSRKLEVELTTISSNYHLEMNPSDVGNNDRYVVQVRGGSGGGAVRSGSWRLAAGCCTK